MKLINILHTEHNLIKTNLVTLMSPKGSYDIMECTKCKLKWRRYNIGVYITITKDRPCTKSKGWHIEITNLQAQGKQFANLVTGSEHDTIPPPEGRDLSEVWVDGVGEPVRLLKGEFKFLYSND